MTDIEIRRASLDAYRSQERRVATGLLSVANGQIVETQVFFGVATSTETSCQAGRVGAGPPGRCR